MVALVRKPRNVGSLVWRMSKIDSREPGDSLPRRPIVQRRTPTDETAELDADCFWKSLSSQSSPNNCVSSRIEKSREKGNAGIHMGGENRLLEQGLYPPQQPWNTDHEAKVTMMATEGARVWSLPLNMFMGFSTVCPRETGCHEVDRSALHHFSRRGRVGDKITHTFKIRAISNKPAQNGARMHE